MYYILYKLIYLKLFPCKDVIFLFPLLHIDESNYFLFYNFEMYNYICIPT